MDDDKKLFVKGPDGKKHFEKKNWRSLFKIDLRDAILIVAILILLFSFQGATKECINVYKNPCAYCPLRVNYNGLSNIGNLTWQTLNNSNNNQTTISLNSTS